MGLGGQKPLSPNRPGLKKQLIELKNPVAEGRMGPSKAAQFSHMCVAYPRPGKVTETARKIAPPSYRPEDTGYRSQPLSQKAIIPKVQWREAEEYLNDCPDGTHMPLCVWLGL
mmetsp:Transcript_17387/g.26910  ORF Transcript_17387/g.26910 Transcript_17387/m.26910 type:complete len:113 (-) Transcript_17387:329-667(-)|eukprot:CAMPEP_0184306352 /NCGR_PEP_ID=MMETSP1049-20130417/15371_1 /TAXON_ID=77928 /ORGANISM="Proteomonas sulcata, Strain CCMP704" /LENGTH=112 /DNA_ID=CAMNT_0026618593 /DNA_START=129 /DNA_END=467 /DNA_ORIENTATION=-